MAERDNPGRISEEPRAQLESIPKGEIYPPAEGVWYGQDTEPTWFGHYPQFPEYHDRAQPSPDPKHPSGIPQQNAGDRQRSDIIYVNPVIQERDDQSSREVKQEPVEPIISNPILSFQERRSHRRRRTIGDIKRDWNRQADAYLAHRLTDEAQFDFVEGPAVDDAIRKYKLNRVPVVLDAGCGPGLFADHLTRTTQIGKIIAVDFSSRMIDLARKRVDPRRVELIEASITDMSPIEDNSCHAAFCLDTAHYFNRRALVMALSEMSRVVTPDGILTLSFKHPVRNAEYRKATTGVDNYFFDGWHDESWNGMTFTNYYRTTAEWLNEVKKQGWDIIEFVEFKPSEELRETNHDMYAKYLSLPRGAMIIARNTK